jgi:hypothetical protein
MQLEVAADDLGPHLAQVVQHCHYFGRWSRSHCCWDQVLIRAEMRTGTDSRRMRHYKRRHPYHKSHSDSLLLM